MAFLSSILRSGTLVFTLVFILVFTLYFVINAGVLRAQESSVVPQIERSTVIDPTRRSHLFDLADGRDVDYPGWSYSSGDGYLKKYLVQAKQQQNQREVATALLNSGDLNLLFQRKAVATGFYELAWNEAQKLPADSKIHANLSQPMRLPAFNYSLPREQVPGKTPTTLISMSFEVLQSGGVGAIEPLAKSDELYEYSSKAKRAVKKLTFRPPIVDGKMIPVRLIDDQNPCELEMYKKTEA